MEYLTGAISFAGLTSVRMRARAHTHKNQNQKRTHDTSLRGVQKSLIVPALPSLLAERNTSQRDEADPDHPCIIVVAWRIQYRSRKQG
jgi:hypothetical protein